MEPLESKGACLALLFDEIDEIVDYARNTSMYLNTIGKLGLNYILFLEL